MAKSCEHTSHDVANDLISVRNKASMLDDLLALRHISTVQSSKKLQNPQPDHFPQLLSPCQVGVVEVNGRTRNEIVFLFQLLPPAKGQLGLGPQQI